MLDVVNKGRTGGLPYISIVPDASASPMFTASGCLATLVRMGIVV